MSPLLDAGIQKHATILALYAFKYIEGYSLGFDANLREEALWIAEIEILRRT